MDTSIRDFIEATGLTKSEIERLTGISNGNLSTRARGKLSTPRGERMLFRLLTLMYEDGWDVERIMKKIRDKVLDTDHDSK